MAESEAPAGRRRKAARLRLTVGVPVTLTLVALAAGVGAINLLVYLNPAADQSPARFWATLVVVAFSLLAGGFGWWIVRILERPLEELTGELEARLGELRPASPTAGAGRPAAGEGSEAEGPGTPVTPAEEVASARRTIEEYLAVLDEARLDAALLEELDQAVIGVAGSGRIVHANAGARRTLAGGGELRGREVTEVLGEEPANLELRGMVRRCLEEVDREDVGGRRTVVSEEVALDRAGEPPLPVRARAHFSPAGFSTGGVDPGRERPVVLLTLQGMDEAERRELLMERRDRLAALGTLVAEVAHEIRNPLGSLRSLAELIAGRLPEGDDRREGLEEITGRVDRVVGYLDEVLDYAQPRRLEREETSVVELMEDASAAVGREARERGVEIAVEPGPAAGRTVRVDGDRMARVLENLARNGVQHAGEGGAVTLRALGADDGGTVLEVHNTGSFIPEADRADLFRPFESGRPGGTGLGLTLARYLVRLHGGRLELESDPERGTAFRVVLPET